MQTPLIQARSPGMADRLCQPQIWFLSIGLWLLNLGLLLVVELPELLLNSAFPMYQITILLLSLEWAALLLMPLLVMLSSVMIETPNTKTFTFSGLLTLIAIVCGIETLISSYSLFYNQSNLETLLRATQISPSEVISWYLSQSYLLADLQKYLLCVALSGGLFWYESAKSLRITQTRFDKQLEACELALQRAQLNTHFLFNSLNSISALVRTKRSSQALEAITELSLLLRNILVNRMQECIKLDTELALITHYIQLQKLRFGEKLRFEQNVSQPASQAIIPVLLLLPLIENAIKHGSKSFCRVILSANINEQRLMIHLSNTLDELSPVPGFGIGHSNNQKRLKLLYGNDFKFAAEVAGNEYLVKLELPLAARNSAS